MIIYLIIDVEHRYLPLYLQTKPIFIVKMNCIFFVDEYRYSLDKLRCAKNIVSSLNIPMKGTMISNRILRLPVNEMLFATVQRHCRIFCACTRHSDLQGKVDLYCV